MEEYKMRERYWGWSCVTVNDQNGNFCRIVESDHDSNRLSFILTDYLFSIARNHGEHTYTHPAAHILFNHTHHEYQCQRWPPLTSFLPPSSFGGSVGMQSSPALLPLFYDNDIRSYLTIWLKFISDRHMLHNATSNQIKSFLELEFPYQPLFVYLLKWTLGWQLTLTDLIPLILNLWRAILPLLLPPPWISWSAYQMHKRNGTWEPALSNIR